VPGIDSTTIVKSKVAKSQRVNSFPLLCRLRRGDWQLGTAGPGGGSDLGADLYWSIWGRPSACDPGCGPWWG
jgi:hypothetical protein